LLHLDFLYMGPSEDGSTNLLLLKGDAGRCILLVRSGTSEATNALLSWFALFLRGVRVGARPGKPFQK
jgi:hypothetical protein